jgi:hypothetical protein
LPVPTLLFWRITTDIYYSLREQAGFTPASRSRIKAPQSDAPDLFRYRRSLLLRLEDPCRPALENHVHRTAPMGARVLINEMWYKLPPANTALPKALKAVCWAGVSSRCLRASFGVGDG